MPFYRCNFADGIDFPQGVEVITSLNTGNNYQPKFSTDTELVVQHHLGRTPTQIHIFTTRPNYACGQSSIMYVGTSSANGMQWSFYTAYTNSSSGLYPWRGNKAQSPQSSDDYAQIEPPIYADKSSIRFGATSLLDKSGVMSIGKNRSVIIYAYACPEIEEVACQGITLSGNTLSFSDTTAQVIDATPQVIEGKNPYQCTDMCYAKSSDNTVANVYWYLTSGAVWKIGVVPVANGTCTITVHMGDSVANINVTVDIPATE